MKTSRIHLRSIVITVSIVVLVAAIGFYLSYQSRLYRSGITLEVETPLDGEVITEKFITIRGTARNVSRLSLNGRQIFTDEANIFEEKLLLAPGYSIITIEATDRFDREKRHEIEVVYNVELDTNYE